MPNSTPGYRAAAGRGQSHPTCHRTLRDSVCLKRKYLCFRATPTSCDTLCVGSGTVEGVSPLKAT